MIGNKKQTVKIAIASMIVIVFLFSSLLPFLAVDTPNVSQPAQKAHMLIWDAATWHGDNASPLASNPDNWEDGWVPDTGECVVFNNVGTSKNCSWDIAKVFAGFYVNSSYTGTITLGCNITVSGMTLAAGTFKAMSYTITDTANWDSSGGTFTAGTSLIKMTGAGKTLKTATGGGGPYNLQISGTISTTSNITIANDLEIQTAKTLTLGTGKTLAVGFALNNDGMIYQAGNAIEISGASPYPYTGYGTYDGELFLDCSPADLGADIGSTMPGYLHASKTVQIWEVNGHYVQFSPSGVQDVNITALTFGDSVNWTSTSTGSVTFTLGGLEAGRMYAVLVDGVRTYTITASGSGVAAFTYSGPWSEHDFQVTPTSIGSSLSGLVIVIFIVVIIGLVVCIVAIPVNALRNKEPITQKTLVNMVLCIVIGIALIGVIFNILV